LWWVVFTTLLFPCGLRASPSISASAVTIQIGNRTADGYDIDLVPTTEKPKMFNRANCECNVARTVKVTISGASSYDGTTNVYYYIGANCSDTTSRQTSCRQIEVHKLSEYFNRSVLTDITGREVIAPTTLTCTPPSGAKSGANTFFVFIDWDGNQSFDKDNDTIAELEIDYDVEPPDVVRDVKVTAGEESLNVSWTVPSDTDIESLQVLCSRGTLPVFPQGTYKPAYQAPTTVCPSGGDGGVRDGGLDDAGIEDAGQLDSGTRDASVQEDAGAGLDASTASDGGVITGVPTFEGLANLDPAYLCSPSLGATTSGTRIATLQNGVTYYVTVVAVDKAGNASQAVAMVAGVQTEVLDFWED